MYERLFYLYGEGRLTAVQLSIAVSKVWITEEEKAKIIASKAA